MYYNEYPMNNVQVWYTIFFEYMETRNYSCYKKNQIKNNKKYLQSNKGGVFKIYHFDKGTMASEIVADVTSNYKVEFPHAYVRDIELSVGDDISVFEYSDHESIAKICKIY